MGSNTSIKKSSKTALIGWEIKYSCVIHLLQLYRGKLLNKV